MKKSTISFPKGMIGGLIIILLSFNFAEGLIFLQDQTDISESYTAEQTTIITLLNDQPRSQNIILDLEQTSQYLQQHITIENNAITLIPGEKKNILINSKFPEKILSPETHYLNIVAQSENDKSTAKTKIIFTVPGIANPHLELTSETYELQGEEKTISVELENTGNVIMRPKPEIIITQGNKIIKTIEYKTPIQIMPSRTYPITLRIDTSSLNEGKYKIQIKFYDRNDIKITTTKTEFEIKKTYETNTEKINLLMPAIIIGIIALLLSSIIFINKKLKKQLNPTTKQLQILEKKEKKLESELQKLIKETHQTINITNKWIKKHMGKEYELR